ncbi:MAG: GTP-binding protein [Acidiferrobacterales bacterium]|nr:GTP-binding protein [Acidiferrobacterales bacterium]
MSNRSSMIQGVPTNIITGFLGAGKTSAVLNLLNNKPSIERWAVLVNEFGEIGIDGALFEGQHTEEQGVFIREVPGGCMCCTAGLPMQVALAQLLARAKPDRLLIEPTGLGHPNEVLQTLKSSHFQHVLSVEKIITLVDARRIADTRYAEHETFIQQLEIADVIVANKYDLYGESDSADLQTYLTTKKLADRTLVFAEQGVFESSLLHSDMQPLGERATEQILNEPYADGKVHKLHNHAEPQLPETGFLKAVNHGEGFASVGWRFAENIHFDRDKLFDFFNGVVAERLKAAFITDQGEFGFNLSKDTLTELHLDGLEESRIEIIADNVDPTWEQHLFDCVKTDSLRDELRLNLSS